MLRTRRRGEVLTDEDLGPFQYTPKEAAIWYCLRNTDPPEFEVKLVNQEVGLGVFADKFFKKGDFLLEYRGELLSAAEGEEREKSYDKKVGSYMYFFMTKGTQYCMDATKYECTGRYVNDAIGPAKNAFVKVIEVDGKPHIVLFASKTIKPGHEVRYDYGVKDLPWRKTEKRGKNTAGDVDPETPQVPMADVEPETSLAPIGDVEPKTALAPIGAVEPKTSLAPTCIGDAEPETALAPIGDVEPKTALAPIRDAEPDTQLAPIGDVEPKTSLAPIGDVEPKTSLAPIGEVEPKTSLAPIGDVEPKTSLAPIGDVEPKTSLAPIGDVEPKTSLAPIGDVEPKTSLAPIGDVEPKTSLAPIGDAEPETSLAPIGDVEPKTSLAPIGDAEPETALAPIADVEPETALAPRVQVDPETPLSPMADVEPETAEVGPDTQVEPWDPETPLAAMTGVDPKTPLVTKAVYPETPVTPLADVEPRSSVAPEEYVVYEITPVTVADVDLESLQAFGDSITTLSEVNGHLASDLPCKPERIVENSCDSCDSTVFPNYGSVLSGHEEPARGKEENTSETNPGLKRIRSVRNHQRAKYQRLSSETEEEMDISDKDDGDYKPEGTGSDTADASSGGELKTTTVKKACRTAKHIISDEELDDEVHAEEETQLDFNPPSGSRSRGKKVPAQRKHTSGDRTSWSKGEKEAVTRTSWSEGEKEAVTRTSWSKGEKEAVTRQMEKFIRLLAVPGKRHCDQAIKQEPVLHNRTWKQVKYCVKNMITTKKRRSMLL